MLLKTAKENDSFSIAKRKLLSETRKFFRFSETHPEPRSIENFYASREKLVTEENPFKNLKIKTTQTLTP